MSEADAVNRSQSPVTVASLVADFEKLGVLPGTTLLVHSSLSALGWVCGGPVSVILALEQALDESGTLVMPAQSGEYSDPAYWRHPPVPESWWQTIRDEMPAFDPDLTPTRGVGVIPEAFRKQPGTLRSRHPQVSFTARGPLAARITEKHPLDYAFGDGGPLGTLYGLDASILLLGCGYANNTSLHLAEFRASYRGKRTERGGAPVMENGRRVWKVLEDFGDDSDDFGQIGEAFEKTKPEKISFGRVGLAEARLMRQRDIVDFAAAWMSANRK